MKKLLPIVTALSLAALLFSSAYALSAPATAPDMAAKPTQPPGRGKAQGQARGGPCRQLGQSGADQAGAEPGRVHYEGVLSAVGAASVTISTTVSGTVTINVNAATCIQMPPKKGLSLSDLSAGMRVGVLAEAGSGGNPTAIRIQAHKPRPITYVGTVTAYTAGTSIALQPDTGGSPLTFTLNANTEIKPWHRVGSLAVGSRVTLQSVRDFVGANPPVLRIVVHGANGDDD